MFFFSWSHILTSILRFSWFNRSSNAKYELKLLTDLLQRLKVKLHSSLCAVEKGGSVSAAERLVPRLTTLQLHINS